MGKNSDDASRELTVMRAYILAANGLLGEHFFEYPQLYATEGLLPSMLRTSPLVPDSVYALLGATPMCDEKPETFLSRMAHSDSATTAARDYYLTSLLLEKRIFKFKEEINDLYGFESVDSFPKHYREALLLYADIADSTETVTFKIDDEAMYARLDALRSEESKHSDVFVRGNYVRRHFGDTYWWYFLYYNWTVIQAKNAFLNEKNSQLMKSFEKSVDILPTNLFNSKMWITFAVLSVESNDSIVFS